MVAATPALREINAGNLDVDFASRLSLGLYIFFQICRCRRATSLRSVGSLWSFPTLKKHENFKTKKIKGGGGTHAGGPKS